MQVQFTPKQPLEPRAAILYLSAGWRSPSGAISVWKLKSHLPHSLSPSFVGYTGVFNQIGPMGKYRSPSRQSSCLIVMAGVSMATLRGTSASGRSHGDYDWSRGDLWKTRAETSVCNLANPPWRKNRRKGKRLKAIKWHESQDCIYFQRWIFWHKGSSLERENCLQHSVIKFLLQYFQCLIWNGILWGEKNHFLIFTALICSSELTIS